jgi:hypothetical protein
MAAVPLLALAEVVAAFNVCGITVVQVTNLLIASGLYQYGRFQ